jgi:hypothetical protein
MSFASSKSAKPAFDLTANAEILVYSNPMNGNELTISGIDGQVMINVTNLNG